MTDTPTTPTTPTPPDTLPFGVRPHTPPLPLDITLDNAFVTEIMREVDAGHISISRHPDNLYAILNYTPRAQYAGHWTDTTLTCRGLIVVPTLTGRWQMVGRGFPKFFNWGEYTLEAQQTILDAHPDLLSVTGKEDGSLGIIVPNPSASDVIVATRGSFTSPQAEWANTFLQTSTLPQQRRYLAQILRDNYITPLVEIIYPGNRIVVDYRNAERFVLLDVLDNRHGLSIYDPASRLHNQALIETIWDSLHPTTIPAMNVAVESRGPEERARAFHTLHTSNIPGHFAEGMVVSYRGGQLRAKIKYPDYLRLHKLMTGLNARHIWEMKKAGTPLDSILDDTPDEFMQWVMRTERDLNQKYAQLRTSTKLAFKRILEGTLNRKDFAEKAMKEPWPAAMFMLYDQKYDAYDQWLWDQIKPEADTPFANGDNE